ncbi:uncharacterized protein [Paramisgurnus dabryanus]|uniref:uncharacterized protein isoform X2 n=1 Tax=Paramisgurnus dabryanus TaxID=90735 RepID=UPI0031F351A5
MKMITFLFIISLFINGVFGDEVKSVSVMKGDSLTLHTDTKLQKYDIIDWRFGETEDRIAQINSEANMISIYDDVLDGRFRGRLNLNNQTGDLTITNITTQHTGLYQLKITGEKTTRKTFSVSVIDVDTDEMNSVSVMDGDSVTLHTDVPDIKKYDVIRWRFQHENSPLAELNRNTALFSTYDDVHDGIFKDKLQLDVKTGSLTIRNIRTKHSGLYEVDLSSTSTSYTIHQSFTVNVSGKVMTVSVIMGESVTLKTNTEIQTYEIQWIASDYDTRIAEIYKPDYLYNIYDGADGRFRDRVQLNNQTGDLTITNITTQHTGLYELKMSNRRQSIQRRFSVHVSVLSSYGIAGLSVGVLVIVAVTTVMVGRSVRLETGVENIKTNDVIEWRFISGAFQKTLIAKIQNKKITGGGDERFSKNVLVNIRTGSLYITNITTNHSGLYEVKITIDGKTSYKKFTVTVTDFNLIKYFAPTNMPCEWKRPASVSQDEHSSVL